MWNSKKSTVLSIVVCWVVVAALTAGVFCGPWLVNAWFTHVRAWDPDHVGTQRMLNLFCSAFYPCAVLAYVTLYNLIRMLYSIHDNQVFIQPNVARLRRISWCCFGVAAVTLVVGVLPYNPFTTPFLLVAVAAAFVGLMLRVVKNVMERAVEIREENELTI